MSTWVMACEVHAGRTGAVLADSVSEYAFGPIFDDVDTAIDFLEWCDENGFDELARERGGARLRDVRQCSDQELSDLAQWHREYREWKQGPAAIVAAHDERDV